MGKRIRSKTQKRRSAARALPIGWLLVLATVVVYASALPGDEFVFDDKIKGGAIPREYIKSVEQGIKEALETGIMAGFPVIDVKVE